MSPSDSRPQLIHHVGPPKFLTHPYARVAPLHPGQPIVCIRSLLLQWLQASPLSEGWPTANALTRIIRDALKSAAVRHPELVEG